MRKRKGSLCGARWAYDGGDEDEKGACDVTDERGFHGEEKKLSKIFTEKNHGR